MPGPPSPWGFGASPGAAISILLRLPRRRRNCPRRKWTGRLVPAGRLGLSNDAQWGRGGTAESGSPDGSAEPRRTVIAYLCCAEVGYCAASVRPGSDVVQIGCVRINAGCVVDRTAIDRVGSSDDR